MSGAHNHDSWRHDDFRRVMLNAILWTAHVDVPREGCPITAVTDTQIKANLDQK